MVFLKFIIFLYAKINRHKFWSSLFWSRRWPRCQISAAVAVTVAADHRDHGCLAASGEWGGGGAGREGGRGERRR